MAFSPRKTAYSIYGNEKWYSANNPYYPYYQMPNCTSYAYGRFWELTGSRPVGLCGGGTGNGGEWYGLTTGYQKGQTPLVGAIACWYSISGKYAGHVGVVEEILDNGDLVISESGWISDSALTQMIGIYCNRSAGILPIKVSDTNIVPWFWKLETAIKNEGYLIPWMYTSRDYKLAGFIYPNEYAGYTPPKGWDYIITDNVPDNWTLANKQNNAVMIYNSLIAKGWDIISICAVLGNMETESYLNPGQCEIGAGLPDYDLFSGVANSEYYVAGKGLALIGWTDLYYNGMHYPNGNLFYSKMFGTSWYDGEAQCDLLDREDEPRFQYLGTDHICSGWLYNSLYPQYDDTLEEFKTNAKNRTIDELTKEFLYIRERPANPTATEKTRINQAKYWYDFLKDINPGDPGGSNPMDKLKTMPLWMKIRYH